MKGTAHVTPPVFLPLSVHVSAGRVLHSRGTLGLAIPRNDAEMLR